MVVGHKVVYGSFAGKQPGMPEDKHDAVDEMLHHIKRAGDSPESEAKRHKADGDLNLELEFERVIEQHHRETSMPPEEANEHINEKDSIHMIARELEKATTPAKEEKEKPLKKVDGIPADSELFNTNEAVAAYNALSSQLPPLAGLSNAQLLSLPLPIIAPDYLPPRIQLLINTLPTLDNLATQLLRIVAVGPYQKIIDLASNSGTPAGATYRDLTSLFEFTKRLYSEEDPFITVEHIAPGMWKEGDKTPSMFSSREQSIESTLRKVNLATFLAATLGTIEVGFFYLNESFLDVFCPANNLDPDNSMSNMTASNVMLQGLVNNSIGETVGKLLKPQAVLYLDLKTQAYISAIEAGERLHQEILEDIFPPNLEEIILLRRTSKLLSPVEIDFIERCQLRKETLANYPSDRSLSEEYGWFSFLNNLFDYVAKNMGFLIWGKKGRLSFKTVATKKYTPHSQAVLASAPRAPRKPVPMPTNDVDNKDLTELTSTLLPSEIQEQQIHLRLNPNAPNKNPHRRPWTREEEKALRHALELKGPAWLTILDLFGAGGKISEVLKNRSQVQLKDKARNWKMFFLKSGLPVPTYLQKVTGDLDRDDRSRGKAARSQKTAAAPIPNSRKDEPEKKAG